MTRKHIVIGGLALAVLALLGGGVVTLSSSFLSSFNDQGMAQRISPALDAASASTALSDTTISLPGFAIPTDALPPVPPGYDSTLGPEQRALIAEHARDGKRPNRLIYSDSPYLLQYAFSSIDWHPWGEAAFEKARTQDKPIFLSMGHFTCYWCHVTKRTVFDDPAIAKALNDVAIPVKVDRVEQPDVERIYGQTLAMIKPDSGLPMSFFLTPERKPFFGADYIPPERQGQQASFLTIVMRISDAWHHRREDVEQSAEGITKDLQQRVRSHRSSMSVGDETLDAGYRALKQAYDSTDGGFGDTPRQFKSPTSDFLLHYYERTKNEAALEMATHTLRAMANGGIYDHIGDGFHPPSGEQKWFKPQFAKMLYDQAQLTNTYLHAYEITGTEEFAQVARNVLAFVDREMTRPEGGFYSSLNDRTRSQKGRYYVWTTSEIEEHLSPEQAKVFTYVFGVEPEGNVGSDPRGPFGKANILYRAHSNAEAAETFGMSVETVISRLEAAEKTLFQVRQRRRPAPRLDPKSITAWNGMMLTAYARAYDVLGDASYRRTAVTTAHFLLDTLYNEETGTLSRRYWNGNVAHNATLADYARLAQGLLALHETTGTQKWLDAAEQITNRQIELFYDKGTGGFYHTTSNQRHLLVRSKAFRPLSNAVALEMLVALHRVTGTERYGILAEETFRYFGEALQQNPTGLTQFLTALKKRLEAAS